MLPLPLHRLLAVAAVAALARAKPDLAESAPCNSQTLCTNSYDPSVSTDLFLYCVNGTCQNILDNTVLAAYTTLVSAVPSGTRTVGQTCDLTVFRCNRDVGNILCAGGKCVDLNSGNAPETFFRNLVGDLPLPGPGDGPPTVAVTPVDTTSDDPIPDTPTPKRPNDDVERPVPSLPPQAPCPEID